MILELRGYSVPVDGRFSDGGLSRSFPESPPRTLVATGREIHQDVGAVVMPPPKLCRITLALRCGLAHRL